MSPPNNRPAHHGVAFAPPLHSQPKGATDLSKVKLRQSFNVAIIGASTGIGKHICLAYARAGASGLLISSRRREALEEVAQEIRQINASTEVTIAPADVSSDADVKQISTTAEAAFSRSHGLDVCVCNAGVVDSTFIDAQTNEHRWPRGVTESDTSDFLRVMDTNLTGAYLAAHYFVPLLERAKDGAQALILTSSGATHFSDSNYVPVAYSLSKFATTRLAEQVSEAHGKSGVSAFALHPGGVNTQGVAAAMPSSVNPACE